MNKEKIRDILYSFIDFHTTREIDRLDLRVLADRFLEEEINDWIYCWVRLVWDNNILLNWNDFFKQKIKRR